MTNSADPDQLASSEANIWIYTVCKDRVYPGSAGQGLKNFNVNVDADADTDADAGGSATALPGLRPEKLKTNHAPLI